MGIGMGTDPHQRRLLARVRGVLIFGWPRGLPAAPTVRRL